MGLLAFDSKPVFLWHLWIECLVPFCVPFVIYCRVIVVNLSTQRSRQFLLNERDGCLRYASSRYVTFPCSREYQRFFREGLCPQLLGRLFPGPLASSMKPAVEFIRTSSTEGRSLIGSDNTYLEPQWHQPQGNLEKWLDTCLGIEIRIKKKLTTPRLLLCAQHCARGFCSSCRLGMKQLSCSIVSLWSQQDYWCYCSGSMS